jgi:cytochrome b subunit of formate dehydrogenase
LTDNREIRKFGGIALVFFGFLSALGFFTNKPLPTYIFGFLTILGLGFIIIPSPLRPIYTTWLKIAHFIGRIVTTLILTLAYYMVITPSALIKRMISGSPIPNRPNKQKASYWVDRIEPTQPKERFLKRY